MVIWHRARKKKSTGGLYRQFADKKKRELGRTPAHTKISVENKIRTIRMRGANFKQKALGLKIVNLFDSITKKFSKADIKKVIDNKSSRHFARMGVMTKGAVIETTAGKAKITNRPGQEGYINAVLIK